MVDIVPEKEYSTHFIYFLSQPMSQHHRHIEEVHLPVLRKLNDIIQKTPHTLEVNDYGHKWVFPNGMRCDLLCHQAKRPAVLRVSRGAWFVKQHPVLLGLFDEVLTVIAKIYLSDVQMVDQKNIFGLFELMYNAPKGIGAFDE